MPAVPRTPVREPCDLERLRSRITEELLDSLGVRLIYRLDASSPGSLVIGPAPKAGATAPDLLVSVVEDHTNRPDNISKLRRAATAAERHVLIWIHADRSNLTAAMAFDVLPTRRPRLPAEVDVVWVASAYEQPTVWRVDLAGWTDQTSKVRRRAGEP